MSWLRRLGPCWHQFSIGEDAVLASAATAPVWSLDEGGTWDGRA